MPRDSSGNYTLVSGNPVVTGTTIESTWANATLGDIAIALTDSLSRSGNGGMLAPLGFSDGTVLNPGIFFNSQPNMGIHRVGSNELAFTMGGASALTVTPSGISAATTGATDKSVSTRNSSGGVRLGTAGADSAISQISSGGAAEDVWVRFVRDGSVFLYYDNTQKFSTTSGGIAVTGEIAASGVVSGNRLHTGSGSDAVIRFANNDWITFFDSASGDIAENTFLFTADGADPQSPNSNTVIQTGQLRLTSTTDASPSSTGHAFQIGPNSGANTTIDNNEILFRNDGDGQLTIFASGVLTWGQTGQRAVIRQSIGISGLDLSMFSGSNREAGPAPGFRSASGNVTLAAGDYNGTLRHTGGAGTITIPNNSSVAFPLGTVINIWASQTSGNRTLAPASGVTLRWHQGGSSTTGSRTVAASSSVSITKVATNEWLLTGNGIS